MTDRKAAQKMADSLEELHRRKMSEAQIRKLFTEAYAEIHGDTLRSSSIAEFLTGWIKRKEREVGQLTWEKYRKVAERFMHYLGDAAGNDLNYLTTKAIAGFRDALSMELSNSTANNYLKVLRVALNEAHKDNLISENVAAKVPGLKVQGGQSTATRRPFTLEELQRLIDVAEGEWEGIIMFGAYTGQRLGDIARICWINLDLPNRTIAFQSRKTNRPMVIPMAPDLQDYLISLQAQDDPHLPVFPEAYKIIEKTGRTGHLSNQFYEVMVAAGLAKPRSHKRTGDSKRSRQTNPLSFHSLRHTTTSMFKNAGVSEAVAMDIVGHESKAVSRNYTHIEIEAKKRAIDNLPSIKKA